MSHLGTGFMKHCRHNPWTILGIFVSWGEICINSIASERTQAIRVSLYGTKCHSRLNGRGWYITYGRRCYQTVQVGETMRSQHTRYVTIFFWYIGTSYRWEVSDLLQSSLLSDSSVLSFIFWYGLKCLLLRFTSSPYPTLLVLVAYRFLLSIWLLLKCRCGICTGMLGNQQNLSLRTALGLSGPIWRVCSYRLRGWN